MLTPCIVSILSFRHKQQQNMVNVLRYEPVGLRHAIDARGHIHDSEDTDAAIMLAATLRSCADTWHIEALNQKPINVEV